MKNINFIYLIILGSITFLSCNKTEINSVINCTINSIPWASEGKITFKKNNSISVMFFAKDAEGNEFSLSVPLPPAKKTYIIGGRENICWAEYKSKLGNVYAATDGGLAIVKASETYFEGMFYFNAECKDSAVAKFFGGGKFKLYYK